MKSITALVIAFGFAASGVAIAADNTGNAPGGTGVEQSTESMGATNKQGDTAPSTGAGSQQRAGPPTGTEPGTGIEDSVQGEGATAKQGKDDSKENKSTNMGGASTGNAPGGTGVEQSTEGQGSTNKN